MASRLADRIEEAITAARQEYPTQELTLELGYSEFEAFEHEATAGGASLKNAAFIRGLHVVRVDKPRWLGIKVPLNVAWITVKHDECGGELVLVKRKPWKTGDHVPAEHFLWPDGTVAKSGEQMRCHSCGRDLGSAEFMAAVTAAVKAEGLLET